MIKLKKRIFRVKGVRGIYTWQDEHIQEWRNDIYPTTTASFIPKVLKRCANNITINIYSSPQPHPAPTLSHTPPQIPPIRALTPPCSSPAYTTPHESAPNTSPSNPPRTHQTAHTRRPTGTRPRCRSHTPSRAYSPKSTNPHIASSVCH